MGSQHGKAKAEKSNSSKDDSNTSQIVVSSDEESNTSTIGSESYGLTPFNQKVFTIFLSEDEIREGCIYVTNEKLHKDILYYLSAEEGLNQIIIFDEAGLVFYDLDVIPGNREKDQCWPKDYMSDYIQVKTHLQTEFSSQ